MRSLQSSKGICSHRRLSRVDLYCGLYIFRAPDFRGESVYGLDTFNSANLHYVFPMRLRCGNSAGAKWLVCKIRVGKICDVQATARIPIKYTGCFSAPESAVGQQLRGFLINIFPTTPSCRVQITCNSSLNSMLHVFTRTILKKLTAHEDISWNGICDRVLVMRRLTSQLCRDSL